MTYGFKMANNVTDLRVTGTNTILCFSALNRQLHVFCGQLRQLQINFDGSEEHD